LVRDGDVGEADRLRLASPAGTSDAGDGETDIRSRPGADALCHLNGSLFADGAVLVERLAGNADPLFQHIVVGNDAAEEDPRGTRSLCEDVTDESSGQRFSNCQLQSFVLQARERLQGKSDEIVRWRIIQVRVAESLAPSAADVESLSRPIYTMAETT